MAKGKKEPIATGGDLQDRIKLALAKTAQDFGAGAVTVLGQGASPVKLKRKSSGSHKIDEILGGGYPEGRIIEIYGVEAGGKCLVESTRILTPNGYKTIREIFNEVGLNTHCINKSIEISYPLINKDGEVENTTHFVFNGRRRVHNIQTRTGLQLQSTAMHPLLVVDKNGFMVWKYTQNIEAGDYLVTRRGDNFSSNEELVSETEAYLLGILVADGYFSSRRLGFTNDDEYIKDFYEGNINIIPEFAGLCFRKYPNGNSPNSFDYHINIAEAVGDFYNRVGVKSGVAKDKEVPHVIMNSSVEIQKSFIRGYFDCECDIRVSQGSIEVCSASHGLLSQVQIMLKNIGIISMLNEKVAKGYEHNQYWRLQLYDKDFRKYLDEIGFDSPSRKEKSGRYKWTDGSSNHDCLPNIQKLCKSYYASVPKKSRSSRFNGFLSDFDSKVVQCSRYVLKELLSLDGDRILRSHLVRFLDESLYFDLVVTNEIGDKVPTFDFSMERTHSFIAESIVNHNTSVSLHAVAMAQKLDKEKLALYIDAEHSLDLNYARALGVDLSRLLLAQPDTAEEALRIVELWMELDCISIYVVDSVAAMIPKAELDGEIGDSHMATLARLMSMTLKKIARLTNMTKTIGIFINQIREKPGVSYGNPEITSGGRALKFYASIRLDVRPRELEKDKENNPKIRKTSIKAVKNKVHTPYLEAIVDIEFGKGISRSGEIIDIGVDLGLIAKSGNWYSYKDILRANGRQAMKDMLEANVEIMDELDELIGMMLTPNEDINSLDEPELGDIPDEESTVFQDTLLKLDEKIDGVVE